jgi:hypothetical protein
MVTRSPIEKSGGALGSSGESVGGGEEHAGGLMDLADGTIAGGRGRGVRNEAKAEKKGGGRERWGR